MQKQNRHSVLLVWIQVLLLLFPTAIKAIHRHARDVDTAIESRGVILYAPQIHSVSCPICDFEFVKFVQPLAVTLPDAPELFGKPVVVLPSFVYGDPVILPFLRAPPIC
jgi:hypothetical protein